jgi:hypothetical protein
MYKCKKFENGIKSVVRGLLDSEKISYSKINITPYENLEDCEIGFLLSQIGPKEGEIECGVSISIMRDTESLPLLKKYKPSSKIPYKLERDIIKKLASEIEIPETYEISSHTPESQPDGQYIIHMYLVKTKKTEIEK